MAHSNPNLTPTVITDKTGKVTTVHKRQEKQSQSRSSVPAPALSAGKTPTPTTASRLRSITRILSEEMNRTPNKTRAKRLIDYARPANLAALDEALTAYENATPHERSIIHSALLPLTSREQPVDAVFELLALRSAFLSERSTQGEPRLSEYILESYVYGVRKVRTNYYDMQLSWRNEVQKAQNLALLRFSYELHEHGEYGNWLPTSQAQVGRDGNRYSQDYKDANLTNLICENFDRVDELIEAALAHKTCDPQQLKAFLEHDGPKSMTSGWL